MENMVDILPGSRIGLKQAEGFLIAPGWWEKELRFIYSKTLSARQISKFPVIKPIMMIGATAELAQELIIIGKERKIPCKVFTKEQLNLNDLNRLDEVVASYNPWAIINATEIEYTGGPNLEERILSCTAAALNLSIICANDDIKLLTFSTDMIINKDDSQYSLKDEYDPQKIYWISKSKTDEQLLIYNPDALIIRPAQNFSSSGRWTHVPQLFSPFNSRDLINSCLDFLIHNESGIWYLDGDGIYSWPEIVRKMVLHPN